MGDDISKLFIHIDATTIPEGTFGGWCQLLFLLAAYAYILYVLAASALMAL